MSSCIDDIVCPDCGKNGARREQDTETCEVHIYCNSCDYDSDEDYFDEDYLDEDYEDDEDYFDEDDEDYF